jgi:hypothetical protein
MPSYSPELRAVFVERSCFLGMVMAAMEVYSKETTGLIVGRNTKRFISGSLSDCVVLEEAYPLQTAKRAFNFVMVGNTRAFDRARETAAAYGVSILGEFHSHPDREPVLTPGDKRYIREQIIKPEKRELRLAGNRWLELVIGISKKRYERPHRIGWFPARRTTKAGIINGTLKTDPLVGFDIRIRAYWVGMKVIKETPLYYSIY